eukprot:TRINITY_DN25923_c0_g1_i1.p1 TRINITY_DN25923_c0_g1~~TRINITY_DN25923_c0_g1_i1.p1  ORF type:complete len:235 (+),score=15.27 TRINITY_DN25923_c0_g1_i1:42-746(+)
MGGSATKVQAPPPETRAARVKRRRVGADVPVDKQPAAVGKKVKKASRHGSSSVPAEAGEAVGNPLAKKKVNRKKRKKADGTPLTPMRAAAPHPPALESCPATTRPPRGGRPVSENMKKSLQASARGGGLGLIPGGSLHLPETSSPSLRVSVDGHPCDASVAFSAWSILSGLGDEAPSITSPNYTAVSRALSARTGPSTVLFCPTPISTTPLSDRGPGLPASSTARSSKASSNTH